MSVNSVVNLMARILHHAALLPWPSMLLALHDTIREAAGVASENVVLVVNKSVDVVASVLSGATVMVTTGLAMVVFDVVRTAVVLRASS